MSAPNTSIKDILYEPPGPKAKRKIYIATAISLIFVLWFLYAVVNQFYITGQLDEEKWFFFGRATTWKFLGEGILGTLEAALAAGVVALAIGFLLMLGRICKYKVLRGIATTLIEITRGVPTLLLIYFVYLGFPRLGIIVPSFLRIVLPVAVSACGVVAEVLRSGVNAVPKGQKEAALSLGMREYKVFLKIILPQALRYVIPALIAELVIVVKDTTFAYIVNFPDLMQNSMVLISNYDSLVPVYLVVAVIYIIINYILNKISERFARKRNSIGLFEVEEGVN